jgi:hypothetical protein
LQAACQKLIVALAVGLLAAVPLASVAAPGDPPTTGHISREASERVLANGVWTSADGTTVTYEADFSGYLAGQHCCRTIDDAAASDNRINVVSAPAATRS